MGEPQADGERAGPRFDPVAGMRAVADIQAEGLRAAGDLLERVLGSEPDRAGRGSGPPPGEFAPLVDAWVDLMRRTVSALTRVGEDGALTVAVDGGGGPQVCLAPGAVSEVWLHNGTFSPAGPLVLNCGQLTAADGAVLEGADVHFEPCEVPVLPPRSSRAVAVSLRTNGSVRAGTYRGTIQANGAPRLWLPLEVAIPPC
jgi:hypothetical protein